MEICPAGARFAAEHAVALVDEVRLLWDIDADLAAEAGELQHSGVISGDFDPEQDAKEEARRLDVSRGEIHAVA